MKIMELAKIMATPTKIEFNIPNRLYGDIGASGYGRGGLVVHRLERGWTISKVSDGARVRGGSVWGTKAVALEKMEKLLALDVAWEKPWDEMRVGFSKNVDAIRAIVMEGVIR